MTLVVKKRNEGVSDAAPSTISIEVANGEKTGNPTILVKGRGDLVEAFINLIRKTLKGKYYSMGSDKRGGYLLMFKGISLDDVNKAAQSAKEYVEREMGDSAKPENSVRVSRSDSVVLKKKVSDATSYSNKFVAWYTGTVLCNVKHPTRGKHQLTEEQVKNSPAEYKNKIFKDIEAAVKRGDLTQEDIDAHDSVNSDVIKDAVFKQVGSGDTAKFSVTLETEELDVVENALISAKNKNIFTGSDKKVLEKILGQIRKLSEGSPSQQTDASVIVTRNDNTLVVRKKGLNDAQKKYGDLTPNEASVMFEVFEDGGFNKSSLKLAEWLKSKGYLTYSAATGSGPDYTGKLTKKGESWVKDYEDGKFDSTTAEWTEIPKGQVVSWQGENWMILDAVKVNKQ